MSKKIKAVNEKYSNQINKLLVQLKNPVIRVMNKQTSSEYKRKEDLRKLEADNKRLFTKIENSKPFLYAKKVDEDYKKTQSIIQKMKKIHLSNSNKKLDLMINTNLTSSDER